MSEATGRTVRIDTHLHTTASYDGETLPEELLRRAEAVGLDGVVVTDHDTVDGAHAVADLAAESPVTAVVGCEVSTADGHLLAIGVEDAPPAGDPLAETAEQVRKAGGVAVVPHPFQRSRHGANATTIDDVDGVEVYNAHTLVNFRNEQAERYARRHGYPAFGGSDAHRPSGIGLAATEVQLEPGAACTPEAVVAAMRAGRTAAVGRRTSTWQYVRKLVANARCKTPSLR